MPRLSIDKQGAEPTYRQVYDQMRVAILSGELAPGARLPASRALAREAAVARITIVRAYGQLEAEGFVESRAGSGTYVASG
ncbi:MAG: GntR family transcriptional regulator, partial [Candidatus Promineofilum sp.]|nr:GntR family transcriptional regulator [Promineifilum sp.]